jgi:hypothetical protein
LLLDGSANGRIEKEPERNIECERVSRGLDELVQEGGERSSLAKRTVSLWHLGIRDDASTDTGRNGNSLLSTVYGNLSRCFFLGECLGRATP